VGKARLAQVSGAQASGVQDIPDGPTVELLPRSAPPPLPDGPLLRVAIDREVPWHAVAVFLDTAARAGKQVVLLVGRRHKIAQFRLRDRLQGSAIEAFVAAGGKTCIGPPRAREYKCVQPMEGTYVDEAFVRELVREAMRGYDLRDVRLAIPRSLPWADVVRAINGARTCCDKVEMRVELTELTTPR
jgi:hypothetical protein